MKRRETRSEANWGGIPSSIHRWMEALLRLAAMCLVSLAKLVVFRSSLPTGECDACQAGPSGSDMPSDPIKKHPNQAVRHDGRTTIALMLARSDPRSGRIDPVDRFEF